MRSSYSTKEILVQDNNSLAYIIKLFVFYYINKAFGLQGCLYSLKKFGFIIARRDDAAASRISSILRTVSKTTGSN